MPRSRLPTIASDAGGPTTTALRRATTAADSRLGLGTTSFRSRWLAAKAPLSQSTVCRSSTCEYTSDKTPYPDYVGGYYKFEGELPAMQAFCYAEGRAAMYEWLMAARTDPALPAEVKAAPDPPVPPPHLQRVRPAHPRVVSGRGEPARSPGPGTPARHARVGATRRMS